MRVKKVEIENGKKDYIREYFQSLIFKNKEFYKDKIKNLGGNYYKIIRENFLDLQDMVVSY